MKKVKFVIKKAFPNQMPMQPNPGMQGVQGIQGGRPGLQLLPSKTNPNVRRWEQTQGKPQQGKPQQGKPQREPYKGKHSGAEVGHRINYYGKPITITGVGEHGVTARDEYGRKYELFHHEIRNKMEVK